MFSSGRVTPSVVNTAEGAFMSQIGRETLIQQHCN